MNKRLISMLLTLCMVFTMFPTAAFAETPVVTTNTTDTTTSSGTCPHGTATAGSSCGYIAAVASAACTHLGMDGKYSCATVQDSAG